jgi:hypothetical protein
LNGNITAHILTLTVHMYLRGQILVPAALPGASLTGGAVQLTAVLDTPLPCHNSILPTGAASYMILGLGFGNLKQENGTRGGAVG